MVYSPLWVLKSPSPGDGERGAVKEKSSWQKSSVWVWWARAPSVCGGALSHLTLPDVQDRVRVVAVCDPVPGRAEAAGQKYGVPAAYQSYEELLADPNVDAVTICTPIGLHFDQGMAAIAAGKHIHFNKTMTTTVDEADRLMAFAAAARGAHRRLAGADAPSA